VDQFEPHLPNLMTFMGMGLSLGLVLSKQVELNLFCNFMFHFFPNKHHHFCLSTSILILSQKNKNQSINKIEN